MGLSTDNLVLINRENDLISVRKILRGITESVGFSLIDTTKIVTSASELTRNILVYAGAGKMNWEIIMENGMKGIKLIFSDTGPGIDNIEQAMKAGYTSANGMGLGLPGAKRLMDDMIIESETGKGTTITVKKWLK